MKSRLTVAMLISLPRHDEDAKEAKNHEPDNDEPYPPIDMRPQEDTDDDQTGDKAVGPAQNGASPFAI